MDFTQYCMKGGKKLSEGGYGCVYYPEIDCNGETKSIEHSKHISKIQKESTASRAEEYIGKIIKTIPNFEFFYAPIVESCPIELSKLKEGDIQDCSIFKKKGLNKNYVLQKVPYIQGQSFLEFFFSKKYLNISGNTDHNKEKETLMFLFDTFPYLIHSLKQLNDIGILHYDFKKENVMFDVQNNTPIVIDFGLSIFLQKDVLKKEVYDEKFGFVETYIEYGSFMEKEESRIEENTIELEKLLDTFEVLHSKFETMKHFSFETYNLKVEHLDFETMKDKFFIYAPDYYLWCPEIHLINYLLHENKTPNKDDLDSMANTIIEESMLSSMFSNFVVDALKQRLRDFFHPFLNKDYKEIVFECLQFYRKWDSYSLCMMYLIFVFNILKQTSIQFRNYLRENNKSIMLEFVVILLDGLHPNPKIRLSFDELLTYFKDMMVKHVEYQSDEYNAFIGIIGERETHIKESIAQHTKKLEETSQSFISMV